MAKKKAPKLKGAAAYTEQVRQRGLTTVVDDVRKKIAARTQRTPLKTVMSKARSY
jgi:hypothetical protein